MTLHIDRTLMERAHMAAQELIKSKGDATTFEGPGSASSPRFAIQRSREGIIALSSFEEQGQIFYVGFPK